MESLKRHPIAFVALGYFFATGIAFAQAQWPTKNARIVVAFPPGGAVDVIARQIGDGLNKDGATVIVENKPGASGAIGAIDVARSAPDGRTLLVTINSFATLTPHLLKMAINPLAELTPVIETSRNVLVLVGNTNVPAKNLAELIAYVKSKPRSVNYASYASGSVSHLGGLLLNDRAGTDLGHVGYKGSAPAMTDLLGGHIPLMFDNMVGSRPLLQNGRILGFAVASAARHPMAPEIPTFRELGYPEMELLAAWILVFAPKGTPPELVERINQVIGKVMDGEQFRTRLREFAFLPRKTNTPAELKAELELENQQFGAFVRAKNITITE